VLYTTIDPKRHWFFNTSTQNILDNKELKYGNVLNLFKLIYFNKNQIILLDSGIYEKLIILLLANNNLSVVLHGELGYKFHNNFKYKFYFKLLKFVIQFSRCKKILLSRYILNTFKCKNYQILEHPGFAIQNKKLDFKNQLFAFGAISLQKLDLNYLLDLNNLFSNHNISVNHYGNSYINISLSNFIFNGYVNDEELNNKLSTSKYLLLINTSKYESIVSGVIIQAIYNNCIIVTLNTYPEIIKFYETYFNTKIHIDIVNFLKLEDKNNYYELNKNRLEKVKDEIFKLSLRDINNIVKNRFCY